MFVTTEIEFFKGLDGGEMGLDGGETHTPRPAWGYNGTVKVLGCNYRDLDGGDT